VVAILRDGQCASSRYISGSAAHAAGCHRQRQHNA
jgi:hypothetical protein